MIAPNSPNTSVDIIAYIGIGIYSVLHILWFIWVFNGSGFEIFDTFVVMGVILPILALLSLGLIQIADKMARFSLLANVISLGAISFWGIVVWYIVSVASASV